MRMLTASEAPVPDPLTDGSLQRPSFLSGAVPQPQRSAPTAGQKPAVGPVRLVEFLLSLHQERSMGGVMNTVATGIVRLSASCHLALLLRDPSTNAWHMTALFDRGARPVPLNQLPVSTGPLVFTPPPDAAPRPLAAVMGAAWGQEACAMVQRTLGVSTAVTVPVQGARSIHGALLAFLATPDHAPLVAGLLGHAATPLARQVDEQAQVFVTHDGVLDHGTLTERSSQEVARAHRYQRNVTIVLIESASVPEMARLGPSLVRALRRWDFIGTLDGDHPILMAVLPETGRDGGRGLLRRLAPVFESVLVGAATCPDDGATLDRLVGAAKGRMARPMGLDDPTYTTAVTPAAARKPAVDALHLSEIDESQLEGAPREALVNHTWLRGAVAGQGLDTVRCPRCLSPYSHVGPTDCSTEMIQRARAAARAHLHADCPRHGNRIEVMA